MVNPVVSNTVGSVCRPASGDPGCRSTVIVLTPALTIEKTTDQPYANLGSNVTYTVHVTNSGQTAQPDATIVDPLANVIDDAAFDTETTTATTGTVTYTTGTLTWSGSLNPGASATITYTVRVNNPASGDRSMDSTVSSTAPGNNCVAGMADSRCTTTVAITDSVSLTFTKTADVESTVAGGRVNYSVTVKNSSASAVNSATFTDHLADLLDDANYNGDAEATGGTVDYTGTDLIWTGTVPAQTVITVTYSVTVRTTASGDGNLSATVSSTSLPASNNCTPDSSDPRCSSIVSVAALVIEQRYTETSTTPGSLIHLTATFTNTGKVPYTGITITSPNADTIDDALPTGDQTATSGTLILNATAITWTGNIPVGDTITITGTLTVKDPTPGNKIITGTLQSTAPGNNCPTDSTDPRCTARTTVLQPHLTITKTANTTYVAPGGTVGYTITVHNTGETPYAGATLTDTLQGLLDDATYNADAAATTGTLTYDNPTLTWTGNLAIDQTATITYTATALKPATGDKTMVNPVMSSDPGSSCPPASGNNACRVTLAVLTPNLTITTAASQATAVPGDSISYTLTVTNSGQTPYSAAELAVPLEDVLDDATYNNNASATTGIVAVAEQTLTWTGALIVGASATITYTVVIDNPDEGDSQLTQTAISISDGSTCVPGGTDPRCSTVVSIAGLKIVNTANVATANPTSIVRFTGTFTNTGKVPYTDISISDSFADALDDATYNGDAAATSGNVVTVVGSGRINWSGDLPVGATVTVTGSVTVNNPDLGNKVLSTSITTDAPASNCPLGGTDPSCSTHVTILIPSLQIAKTANTASTTPGALVEYSITISNSGETPYANAQVNDPLGDVRSEAALTGDVTATEGTVTVGDQGLDWAGDLAIGQIVIIRYTVRVNNPDLGDKSILNQVTSEELGSNCPTGGSDPACSAQVTVLVPALDIAIAASAITATPASTIDYTITITNTGQTDALSADVNTSLAGVLDDASYDGNATATTGSLSFNNSTLTWTGDLTIGTSATITYSAKVNDPDTGNRALTTTISSPTPGSTCDPANPCQNTVSILIPGLTISTSADLATAEPGDQVTFTITLRNEGETAYVGTTLTTDLSDILDDADYSGAATASVGLVSYTGSTLAWTGSLEVGATATITYMVTVRDPDLGDKSLTTTVMAPAAGSNCHQSSTDPACSATVAVLIPQLTISKSPDTQITTPGSTVVYTISVANTGQTNYTGAAVHDSLLGILPDADYNADADVVGGGVLDFSEATLTWTGDLPIGASVTITYSITVHDPDTGDKQMTNDVTSTTPGSTCPPGNNLTACSTEVEVLVPQLQIIKTANVATVTAGDVVQYTISLTNTGQTPYFPATFSDVLSDVLDDASYAGDATSSRGSLEYSNETLAWTGALGIGETATIVYSVTTQYPATGDHSLYNTVSSAAAGSNCATVSDPLCSSTVNVLVPELTIIKTADKSQIVTGETVHYTILATNTGQADYPAASLTDSLTDVLDDAAYNADATATTGTINYRDETLTWTGALPKGVAVLINYTATVNTTTSGDALMNNQAVSTASGSNCPPGGDDSRCTSSVMVAANTMTLEGLTPSFTLNGPPNSTVTKDSAVTMTVNTNSFGGYTVSAQASDPALVGTATGNNDVIPISHLAVRNSGSTPFNALSAADALTVFQKDSPSSPGGDAVSNDYQVQIPFIASDTYETTIEYIATTQ